MLTRDVFSHHKKFFRSFYHTRVAVNFDTIKIYKRQCWRQEDLSMFSEYFFRQGNLIKILYFHITAYIDGNT